MDLYKNVMNFMCGFSSLHLASSPSRDRRLFSSSISLLADFLIIFSSSAPLERHSHNRGMEFQVFFLAPSFSIFSFLSARCSIAKQFIVFYFSESSEAAG